MIKMICPDTGHMVETPPQAFPSHHLISTNQNGPNVSRRNSDYFGTYVINGHVNRCQI